MQDLNGNRNPGTGRALSVLEELIQKCPSVPEVHSSSAHRALPEHKTTVTFQPNVFPLACHISL